MGILWRSDPIANPVGLEARLVDIGGERTLEAAFSENLPLGKRIKAIFSIIVGKSYTISSIYLGGKDEQRAEEAAAKELA